MYNHNQDFKLKEFNKMGKQILEVYVTRYALTKGIQKRTVELTHTTEMVVDSKERHLYYHGEGNEWHYTLKAAIKRANEMKKKKIETLKKQLRKIEALEF